MIRIAGLNGNDFVNGEGVSVSLFLQGCPFHCEGCHNPETWNPKGGIEVDEGDLIQQILTLINANNITRNLSILGGEPLDTEQKRDFLRELIIRVRYYYPEIKIVLWTGYKYNDIKDKEDFKYILENIDYLIDGPFILKERDITLK
jgi:anaerobic ribonucleoside-triphosphate reductase activating protein